MPNSLAAFFVLLLPVAAALGFRANASAVARVWWGWVTLVLLLGMVLTLSRGAWFALGLAVIAWPLCVVRGRWVRRLKVAAFVVLGVALVGGVLYAKVPGFRARFARLAPDAGERTRPIMWRAAWAMFREHPWVGAGAGSYDVLFERYRPERFNDDPLWAHNDHLNTLSDYGLIGFGLFFGPVAAVAVTAIRIRGDGKARRRDGLDSPAALGALGIGLLAFALHLTVEFHLKIPALGLAVATLAGIVVSRRWPAPVGATPAAAPRRVAAALAAVAGAAGFALFLLPLLRAEALRKAARTEIDALARGPVEPEGYRLPVERARVRLGLATALDPANAQAWADLAYATALWARFEPGREAVLGKSAEVAAQRALTLAPVCYEFWIRRGVARDLQGRWMEAGDDFVQAVKRAPAHPWAWYYYADHLSHVYATRESADAAAAFCLRLDPGNQLAIALRQRLAINPKAP